VALFDVLGFVAVVLQGIAFVAQSVVIGAGAFALFAMPVLGRSGDASAAGHLAHHVQCGVRVAAAAVVLLAIVGTMLTVFVLTTTLGLRLRDVADTGFAVAAVAKALAAVVIAIAASRLPGWRARVACVAGVAVLLGAAAAQSHAIARLDHVAVLMLATAAHQLGAGIWLGGLPFLWLALRASDARVARALGRCYSVQAAAGVALIVAAAVVFARLYLGSVDALYATAYGAMAGVKMLLLAVLLLLGLANFRALRGGASDAEAVPRVRRFVEIEMAVGFAVLMAAASLTSSSASVDVVDDRVSLQELAARLAPALPTFTSPAHDALSATAVAGDLAVPRTDGDRAWSEYNHHVAGIALALIGIAAFVQRMRRARWLAHWPLVIVLLGAFLLVRADPEVWPLGSIGPIASLRDPEVLQHRLFVALIAAFALIEWRVQRGHGVSPNLARIFPILMLIGGALLLTHSHAVANAKEQLLIEMTHLPIAVLGVVAGSARWLELSTPNREGRIGGLIWPTALILVGVVLLGYREG
jgi:putative copper resistance protein D